MKHIKNCNNNHDSWHITRLQIHCQTNSVGFHALFQSATNIKCIYLKRGLRMYLSATLTGTLHASVVAFYFI